MVQEWFDEHNNEFEVLTCPPNSPNLNPIQHLWDVLDKQVRSMKAPPHNLQDLKDLLLTSWCQIPQHTFRDLVESIPRWVRAVLAAKGGPTQCQAGGHNLGELGKGAGKGGGGGGAVREAGGAFGKRQAAEEEMYFKKKEREQIATLRQHHQEEISHHQKEIERLQEEISRHEGKICQLKKHD
ncbi:hypothetical protein QTP86_033502 [Hemibagrus guttatus]|nr:hypothetical protein QTP86_033502 [Hemibagrus guttatus]